MHRRFTVRPFICALALPVGVIACDDDRPRSEPKSRVQAVVTSGAVDDSPSTKPARGTTAAQPEATRLPAPAPPRPPLCAGQLDDNGAPFNPSRPPEQAAAEGKPNLPKDPVLGKGQRWTWINFWAAWCKPCKEELPLLLTWQKELAEHLDFAFVSFDDDERQLRDFLEDPKSGLNQTYWLPDGPARMAWLRALSLATEPELPMQLLLDERGRLRCKVPGAVDAGDLEQLKKIISR